MLADVLPKSLFDRVYTAANDPYFTPPDPGFLPTWNGRTGEHIKDIPLLRMYRVSRRRFRALCAEGIDVEVRSRPYPLLISTADANTPQYGKKLKDISYDDSANTVTAIFEDGSTATGSLLVGADGAQSAVRATIFGSEKAKVVPVPYCGVNVHVTYGDTEKALFVRQKHPIMTHAIHPDGYWLWISSLSILRHTCPPHR